ncbi:MAG: LexA family transcriptional regulator [Ruminococcus sp.]|uniref:helix-turn-helix domain-containing protein n=1 Tax=Ruminococcus sp. TaxID=41978 RepID=UPI001B19FFC6|nr:XRE family transcriptional regulator [Ruminococcus sp.]MBO7474743.1 LexA family transcriptional regulator [Ruminococcus sp.]MBO7714013.1 LexA family transcriptional regulator [Methanobrevibacter sp.]
MAIDCKRLKQIRLENGLSQEQMAKKLGLNRRTYSTYEQGTRNMGSATILKVCQTFNLTSDELLGNYQLAEPYEEIKTIRGYILCVVPLYTSADQYINNDYEDQFPDLFPTNMEARETIAVKVAGDSMTPKIDDRNIVTVHKQDRFRNGDIIAAIINGEKGIYIRRAYKDFDSKSITLVPINSDYKKIEFIGKERENLIIIGIVKKIVKSIQYELD